MRKIVYFILLAALALTVAACGGGDSDDAGGADVAAGKKLFTSQIIGTQPGCITCHSLTPDEVIVGPSMAGIASRAGSRVPGLSAEEYIRQSILEPDAYLVETFPAGTMPQVWGQELSDDQVNQIVAYLMTLK
ncbi:MAG: cytochrome c [Anaerolineae bacterium]|jgi:L-cysteine S-thiosulfotransferase